LQFLGPPSLLVNTFNKQNKRLDDEFFFLDRAGKISNYAPKSWSSEKKNVKVHDPFVLHLKIQYFVAAPELQLLGLIQNKKKLEIPVGFRIRTRKRNRNREESKLN